MKKIITNSMRNVFLDCPYRFFCEYVRRLTPYEEAEYFTWGRLVHDGEACLDNDEPVGNAIAVLRKEAEGKCYPPKILQRIDEMCILLPSVVDAHFLRWHKDDENYETLGGEKHGGKFSLELPSGYVFEGKIDKIVRDIRTGKFLTMERKTASLINDEYFEDVLLDSQPKGYLLAAQRCFGIDAHDVLYDLYGKPQVREKQWQTREMYIKELQDEYLLKREKYFQRRRMPFNQEEIDAYFWELDQVAQMLQWHLEEGIWPKHHPRNRVGGCAYRPICLRGDESGFYMRSEEELNPELGG